MFTRKSDQQLLSEYLAYQVPGSHLNQVVQETAKDLGITKPTEVFVSRSKKIQAMMNHSTEGLRIIVTEPMLEALGSQPHSASAEFKAVVGHELGHLKSGMGMNGFGRYLYGGLLPIYALPFIAVAARHYIARAHEKQLTHEQAKHFIYHEADQEADAQAGASAEQPAPLSREESKWQREAKDFAVFCLGAVAGGFVAKVNSHQLEFACDRWGAKVTDPETMRNALLKMEKAFAEHKLQGIKIPDSDPFKYGKVQNKILQWFQDLARHTVASHPDTFKRADKLEKMIAR